MFIKFHLVVSEEMRIRTGNGRTDGHHDHYIPPRISRGGIKTINTSADVLLKIFLRLESFVRFVGG